MPTAFIDPTIDAVDEFMFDADAIPFVPTAITTIDITNFADNDFDYDPVADADAIVFVPTAHTAHTAHNTASTVSASTASTVSAMEEEEADDSDTETDATLSPSVSLISAAAMADRLELASSIAVRLDRMGLPINRDWRSFITHSDSHSDSHNNTIIHTERALLRDILFFNLRVDLPLSSTSDAPDGVPTGAANGGGGIVALVIDGVPEHTIDTTLFDAVDQYSSVCAVGTFDPIGYTLSILFIAISRYTDTDIDIHTRSTCIEFRDITRAAINFRPASPDGNTRATITIQVNPGHLIGQDHRFSISSIQHVVTGQMAATK